MSHVTYTNNFHLFDQTTSFDLAWNQPLDHLCIWCAAYWFLLHWSTCWFVLFLVNTFVFACVPKRNTALLQVIKTVNKPERKCTFSLSHIKWNIDSYWIKPWLPERVYQQYVEETISIMCFNLLQLCIKWERLNQQVGFRSSRHCKTYKLFTFGPTLISSRRLNFQTNLAQSNFAWYRLILIIMPHAKPTIHASFAQPWFWTRF